MTRKQPLARSRRAFVLRHTRLHPVPGLERVRLHLADDVLTLWHAIQAEREDPDAPLPFWAFAWAGGLALAEYLGEHPEVVAGRKVLDLASGSGLDAIAAMQAGAASVVAADIDPFAEAAVALNAKANRVRIGFVGRDLLAEDPPGVDVILAGDTWYEGPFAERLLPWLRRAAEQGTLVLTGDPGRRFVPVDEFDELARYEVRTTTELEDLALKGGRVYTLRPRAGA
jgi:predicted nicotinamide N-methyase